MPALNFKKQFVPKILSGEKSSTIRGKRKTPIKPMDTLILYTGMRTKHCQPIGTAICFSVTPFKITEDRPYIYSPENGKWFPYEAIDERTVQRLCNNDGFADYEEMKTFFRNQYGLPFEGDLIKWKDFKPGGFQKVQEAPHDGNELLITLNFSL